MAVDFNAVGATLTDQTFLNRIVGALEAQLITVNAESAGTANHLQRLDLLGRIARAPAQYAVIFAPLVASVAPVSGLATTSAATDANLTTGVASVYDAVALRGI